MATKKSKPEKLSLADQVSSLREVITLESAVLRQRIITQSNKILALEEAICPRVAARLTALEKAMQTVASLAVRAKAAEPASPVDTLKALTNALEAAAVRVLDYTGNNNHLHFGAVKITLHRLG